jgi:hypothetical protein
MSILWMSQPLHYIHDQGQNIKMKMNQKSVLRLKHTFTNVGECKEMNIKCLLKMNTKGIVTLWKSQTFGPKM